MVVIINYFVHDKFRKEKDKTLKKILHYKTTLGDNQEIIENFSFKRANLWHHF